MKLLLSLVLLVLAPVAVMASQSIPPTSNHDDVYRLNPELDSVKLVLVAPEEIKPGFVYNYYSDALQRRVWGIAREGGGFQYALGEGSTIPTTMFDLRMTPQMEARVLDRRSPRLLSELTTVGRSAAARLDGAGVWALLPFPSSARVFDLLTGERWEWHGPNRHAVVHTGGNLWHIVDGRYLPVTIVEQVATCH